MLMKRMVPPKALMLEPCQSCTLPTVEGHMPRYCRAAGLAVRNIPDPAIAYPLAALWLSPGSIPEHARQAGGAHEGPDSFQQDESVLLLNYRHRGQS